MTEKQEKIIENWKEFASDFKIIESKVICCIERFNFTYGLCVGLSIWERKGRYCFEHKHEAVESLNSWDGKDHPPGNWIKYKGEIEIVNPEFCRI